MQKLVNDVLAILKAPLVNQLDITHLFLLTGLILVFIAAWIMILQHVRLAAAEVV